MWTSSTRAARGRCHMWGQRSERGERSSSLREGRPSNSTVLVAVAPSMATARVVSGRQQVYVDLAQSPAALGGLFEGEQPLLRAASFVVDLFLLAT